MRRPRRRLLLLSGLAVHGLLAAPALAHIALKPDADARIAFYDQQIKAHPRVCAHHVGLAAAYLDKARSTQDPALLEQARSALARALAIQPTFDAYKAMAAVCNFSHRFEEALQWAERAQAANPTDPSITALSVEAFLALGRATDAGALLPTTAPTDFHTAAARANWLTAEGRTAEALRAFDRAGTLAAAQEAHDEVEWAHLGAVGALLGAGHLADARARLERAASAHAPGPSFLIRLAELEQAEGNHGAAIATLERVLTQVSSADVHGVAYEIAHRLGDEARAQLHFEAAERLSLRAIESGEVYTLGALARLYLAAGVRTHDALRLATRNLRYQRDAPARLTETRARAAVRAALVASDPATATP